MCSNTYIIDSLCIKLIEMITPGTFMKLVDTESLCYMITCHLNNEVWFVIEQHADDFFFFLQFSGDHHLQ